jgi:hypothetical protein
MTLQPNISSGQVRRSYLVPPTPGYNTASMEMQVQPSPAFSTMPLCYGEDGRTSTTPTRESFQKSDSFERKHPRVVRWSRIALCVSRIAVSTLLVAAGAAIVGCEGHALQNFKATNLGAQFFLPLWPQDLDLTPTITILAVGSVILTFNLIYLISTAIPYVCPLPIPLYGPINLQENPLCLPILTFALPSTSNSATTAIFCTTSSTSPLPSSLSSPLPSPSATPRTSTPRPAPATTPTPAIRSSRGPVVGPTSRARSRSRQLRVSRLQRASRGCAGRARRRLTLRL